MSCLEKLIGLTVKKTYPDKPTLEGTVLYAYQYRQPKDFEEIGVGILCDQTQEIKEEWADSLQVTGRFGGDSKYPIHWRLYFPTRIVIEFHRNNIENWGDLANCTRHEVQHWRGIGDAYLGLIELKLQEQGLGFKGRL